MGYLSDEGLLSWLFWTHINYLTFFNWDHLWWSKALGQVYYYRRQVSWITIKQCAPISIGRVTADLHVQYITRPQLHGLHFCNMIGPKQKWVDHNIKQARKLQDAQAEKLTSLQAKKLTS